MARFGNWVYVYVFLGTLNVGLPCLKYLESIARIRDAAFKFVSLRPKSHLIADAKNIVCASKRILGSYS